MTQNDGRRGGPLRTGEGQLEGWVWRQTILCFAANEPQWLQVSDRMKAPTSQVFLGPGGVDVGVF